MAAAPARPEGEFWARTLTRLRRCDPRTVLLILLVAFGVRLACLSRSPLIGTDSMRFLYAARNFETGQLWEAIRDPFHPELPFLIAVLNRGQQWMLGAPRDFDQDRARRERAGYAIVFAAGLLVVWLEIDLARTLFPAVPAGAVGLIAACQPYLARSSADIMSDTPMLAWLLLALRAGAAPPDRAWSAAVCGLSIGLAYLARPEGLVALPAVLVFWLLRDRRRPARLAARSGLLLASLALAALPYAIAISVAAGKPTITLKKDVYRMIGIEAARGSDLPDLALGLPSAVAPPASPGWPAASAPARFALASTLPPPLAERLVGSLGYVVAGWFDTAPEVLALAFLIGLWALWRQGVYTEGHTLFALCAGFMVAILVLLLSSEGDPDYLSRRHVFVLVALSLPLAARGLLVLGGTLGEHSARLGQRRGALLLLGVTLLGLTLHATRAHRADQQAQLTAARLIVAQHGHGEVVFTDREKIVYYAGARGFALPADAATLFRALREHPRAWVAFYYEGEQCCGELAAALQAPGSPVKLFRRLEEPAARPPRWLMLYLSEH